MENKLLKASLLISISGIIILYIILAHSTLPFVEAEKINEEHIGKTLKSEVKFSSMKEYNESIIIYPKKVNFRLIAFTDKKIIIEEDSIIEFTGIVDEDKYGIYIIIDNIEIRKIS